ncbi:hypothetical protein C2S51_000936 [Perilla frutescens var. frutescens]|nr:hypothetical protein C2S51_000936 [Perilla frutescens var. frutescens]
MSRTARTGTPRVGASAHGERENARGPHRARVPTHGTGRARPSKHDGNCLAIEYKLTRVLVLTCTIVNLFSALHILIKFRTSYIARNSTIFGRGDLVTDPNLNAIRYLKGNFIIDLVADLPLSQYVVWGIMPIAGTSNHVNHTITLLIIIQYIPRLIIIFPLNWRIIKNTGVVAKNTWTGVAYNLIIYLLASHALGAIWYLMSVGRIHWCWTEQCKIENQVTHCRGEFFDCLSHDPGHIVWYNSTEVFQKCDGTADDFSFGMFVIIYVIGQSLEAIAYPTETIFGILVCIMGLLFFSLLIGNVQTYLQSTTARLEEWRVKRRDTEEWMRHRQLPPNLQERVRRFVQYNWISMRGVKEEDILQELPLDLCREVQKHLCLDLVRRVSPFLLKNGQPYSGCNLPASGVISEHERTADMGSHKLLRQPKPSGFHTNSEVQHRGRGLRPSCRRPQILHHSVQTVAQQEAAALLSLLLPPVEDLGCLHSPIAWRRHRRRKLAEELTRHESMQFLQKLDDKEDDTSQSTSITAALLVRRFAANTKNGKARKVKFVDDSTSQIPKLFKPDEPTF